MISTGYLKRSLCCSFSIFLVCLFLQFSVNSVCAQTPDLEQDTATTTILSVDTLASSDTLAKVHNPIKAAWLSALIPGAGQFYNRKYWKLPILYAGVGACVYFIRFNHQEYTVYRDILINRRENPDATDQFTGFYNNDQVRTLRDFYLRNRDFTVILSLLLYIGNIVDAHVDAHLMTFDVSDNLVLKATPYHHHDRVRVFQHSGVSLALSFR